MVRGVRSVRGGTYALDSIPECAQAANRTASTACEKRSGQGARWNHSPRAQQHAAAHRCMSRAPRAESLQRITRAQSSPHQQQSLATPSHMPSTRETPARRERPGVLTCWECLSRRGSAQESPGALGWQNVVGCVGSNPIRGGTHRSTPSPCDGALEDEMVRTAHCADSRRCWRCSGVCGRPTCPL